MYARAARSHRPRVIATSKRVRSAPTQVVVKTTAREPEDAYRFMNVQEAQRSDRYEDYGMRTIIAALVSGLIISACAARASERAATLTPSSTPSSSAGSNTCPVTVPPQPGFVPPEPYPPELPSSFHAVWYGTPELWTTLDVRGEVWRGLPVAEDGSVGNKTLWWSENFSTAKGEDFSGNDDITVTAVRLDGSAPKVVETPGGAYFNDFLGNFMLVGLVVPEAGCWQITANYQGAELTYMMQVEK